MNATPMVQLLEDIVALLSAPNASAASLSRLLGPVREKYTGSGYELAPVDPRLAKAWIGIREEPGMTEVPTDVEIDFAPTSLLALVELDRALGPRRSLPPAPNGPLYKVVYDRDRGSSTHKATLFATLAGPPDQPNVVVQGLLIRRDTR